MDVVDVMPAKSCSLVDLEKQGKIICETLQQLIDCWRMPCSCSWEAVTPKASKEIIVESSSMGSSCVDCCLSGVCGRLARPPRRECCPARHASPGTAGRCQCCAVAPQTAFTGRGRRCCHRYWGWQRRCRRRRECPQIGQHLHSVGSYTSKANCICGCQLNMQALLMFSPHLMRPHRANAMRMQQLLDVLHMSNSASRYMP